MGRDSVHRVGQTDRILAICDSVALKFSIDKQATTSASDMTQSSTIILSTLLCTHIKYSLGGQADRILAISGWVAAAGHRPLTPVACH